MNRSKTLLRAALGAGLALAAVPAAAEFKTVDDEGWCDEHEFERGGRACEVRETTLAPSGALRVDASPNGGIKAEGWGRGEVRVRAKVAAQADSDDEARAILGQVQVHANGTIGAEGPEQTHRRRWWVSYRLSVPQRSDLDLKSVNGGLHVTGVEGRLALQTLNGGLHLTDLAGDVRARTTNGGVHLELNGTSWRGTGIDASTTNGGLHVTMPEGYNARFEAETVNGGWHVDLPVTTPRRRGEPLAVDLGSGGPPVRVRTTNGGVHVDTR
jgi:hypothetical protein